MKSQRVLHVYSDKRRKFQTETWKAFKSMQEKFVIEHAHVVSKTDYADVLKCNWGKGHDLIIVEQDIVATSNSVFELLHCRARLCCFPYLIKADDPTRYSIFNFTNRSKPDNWKTFDNAKYIDKADIQARPRFCGLSGFGLTKISGKAQSLIDFPRMYTLKRWDIIDSWLSLRLYEKLRTNRIYHIHYPPVKHNHFSPKPRHRTQKVSKILIF